MNAKKKSGDAVVLEFLSEDFWFEMMRRNVRVKKMMLRGGAGDWLLIVSAKIDGDPMVAFVGSSSVIGVARKLHRQFVDEEISWQADKYAD